MHTKTTPGLAFDSLCLVEGDFKIALGGSEAIEELKIRVVYYNRSTGETFGSAYWPMGSWSEKTLEDFKSFLKSAESDVSKLLYGERDEKAPFPRPPHTWEKAETGAPLVKTKGLGGV